MATCRPMVSVYSSEEKGKLLSSIKMPSVFLTPIRPDHVRYIHANMSRNKRQAHGVSPDAGYQTSAESWGTGRAVSRIPRVPGGGTHRAGQAAFGNMCRGGGMFSPIKVWRRWHRSMNLTEKRHAVASAIAATAIPSLVMARGHRIDQIPELPLVLSDNIQSIQKTRKALDTLRVIGCEEELQKVIDSKKIRTGKGKSRNRRHVMRRGPLVVYGEDSGVSKAFRNIPGVDLCHVNRLNLLQLAPGGTVGRLVIWSSSAFEQLGKLYGSASGSSVSKLKKGYHLPRPIMTNADISRIINSDEIQSVVRPAQKTVKMRTTKFNPLKNKAFMAKINPAYPRLARARILAKTPGTPNYAKAEELKEQRRKEAKVTRKFNKKAAKGLLKTFGTKVDAPQ